MVQHGFDMAHASLERPQARKEGLVHTVCACAKVYPKSWYIVYLRKTVREPSYLTYDFTLNKPQHRHRLLPITRMDLLDIGYMNVLSENLAMADTVVPWITSGQRSNSSRVYA